MKEKTKNWYKKKKISLLMFICKIWLNSETINKLVCWCAIGRGVMTRIHQNSSSAISRFKKKKDVLICVTKSLLDDVMHCGQCHGSGAEKSLSVCSLFYHFKCLQLLALIKTHDLGILHWVKFTVNKTVYASVLNNPHCCTCQNLDQKLRH